jgi:hypothetical protein
MKTARKAPIANAAKQKKRGKMICPHCGNEEFRTVDVHRNKVRRFGGWVGSDKDTRLIMCRDCHHTYYTETYITGEVAYDDVRLRQIVIPFQELVK